MQLTFKLKQHTPIIHFQPDQKGATLRATELKPKLDEYIRKLKIVETNFKKYYEKNNSLPYKVTISTDETSIKKEIKKSFPCFWGNMGDGPKKKFIYYQQPFEVTFFSFYKEIIETIEQYFQKFLFITNFGTRQSKGFGSYYIDPSDSRYELIGGNNDYKFTVNTVAADTNHQNISIKFEQLFEHINLFYQTIRSGINIKGGRNKMYFKSLLFMYAKTKGWTWDKKAIKEKFVPKTELDRQKRDHANDLDGPLFYESDDKFLLRDLLGVAAAQKYDSYRFEIKHDEGNNIQRFKSPITFKPIETGPGIFDIHILTFPIPRNMFNETFKINKLNSNEIVDSITLNTPSSFDLNDYLEFAIREIDLTNHAGNNNAPNFRTISSIYGQLKRIQENRITNNG